LLTALPAGRDEIHGCVEEEARDLRICQIDSNVRVLKRLIGRAIGIDRPPNESPATRRTTAHSCDAN
jgi:hypothetical protein